MEPQVRTPTVPVNKVFVGQPLVARHGFPERPGVDSRILRNSDPEHRQLARISGETQLAGGVADGSGKLGILVSQRAIATRVRADGYAFGAKVDIRGVF